MQKNFLMLLAVVGLFTLAGLGQVKDGAPQTPFDEGLAKRLGADDFGMKSYVFCILKTGPKDTEITDAKKRSEIFAGHMANMKRLGDEGKLALAGPFGKNDRAYRGIFIFNVATVEEAEKLVETDPVISSGMMIAELTPWYGSAAVLLVNENHKKVAKKDF
ncbi:MAG TPA: YciI family protein [Pyrinomonadaceae bacterium]|nr:YciI family protein [Pyrinomonadaceae bacterium]HMP65056.1 YciI family protein [Pyrinomonadaceae bacterium]